MAQNILGKSIPDLRVNTTKKKIIPVEGELVQVPEELMNIHKDIYFTLDLFFVNGISLFLTLSRKI